MRQSFIIKYFNNKKIKLLSYERDNFQHCCANIVACWCVRVVVVSKRIQQLPTTPKNMQQGLQTDAACNIHQCCVRLQGGLNLPEISRYSIKYLFLPIFVSLSCFLPNRPVVAQMFQNTSVSSILLHLAQRCSPRKIKDQERTPREGYVATKDRVFLAYS